MRKKRFLIGGILLLMAVGYLSYVGFAGGAVYYYTVSELIEQGDSIYGETVRVNGEVVNGSIQQESLQTLRFTVSDGEASLPVFYQGVVPDTFKVGNAVVIEGHIDSSGVFQAQTLMPKCPSRYVPKK